jgi:hypothetical protein
MKPLSKEESRQRWSELRAQVNAWDPIGLIGMGSPPDEYECIVGPLMRYLESGAPAEEIQTFLSREFAEHFSVPVTESTITEFVATARVWFSDHWL